LNQLDALDQAGDAVARPSLILMDKGFADDHALFCNSVRRHPAGAHIPIIVVRSDIQWSTESIADNVTVILGNPLTAPRLAKGIQRALGLYDPLAQTISGASFDVVAASLLPGDAEILLAEDNATNQEVVTRQLMRLGYACDVAKDGQEAWGMLQANPGRYRLLLTDCHMPKLDGYELTKKIRRNEAAQGLPHLNIVAITANALQGEGERCLAMGMDAFLAKPMQMHDLKRILVRMLPPNTGQAVLDPIASSPVPHEFAELASLLGNDDSRLQRVLEVFVTSVRRDMELWAAARQSCERETLRGLAHKLKSGCRQLSATTATYIFDALEQHVGEDSEFDRLADVAMHELALVLARVEAYRNRSGKVPLIAP
jgi:CheY-like chemotaxis protein